MCCSPWSHKELDTTERTILLLGIYSKRGGHVEIPFVQGKEQQLCMAGAAVKRYPTSKVRETQVRW